jgi:hypothetical protein
VAGAQQGVEDRATDVSGSARQKNAHRGRIS